MSRFDILLRKYREKTAVEPDASFDSLVIARLREGRLFSVASIIAAPVFLPIAVAAGLAIGLSAIAVFPPPAPDAVLPELALFAPDTPHLPSTWIGRTK